MYSNCLKIQEIVTRFQISLFAVKKRLDNAFDSCYKQGKKRQFSHWGWPQARHSPKEAQRAAADFDCFIQQSQTDEDKKTLEDILESSNLTYLEECLMNYFEAGKIRYVTKNPFCY